MGNINVSSDDLVHLLRAGLVPDPRQFEALARRIVRRLRRDNGIAAEVLIAALEDGLRQSSAARSVVSQVTQAAHADAERFLITPQPNEDAPLLRHTVIKQIHRIILEQRRSEQLAEAGLKASRTALFVGPPGVGKTMTAQWIAQELRRPFYILNLASIMSSKLGQSGANVADAMARARSHKAVLLLDEFDAVAKRRDDDDDIGEAKRIVTVLLQEIDRWPDDALLLAATNHGELLDRAVWRRFDAVVEFPLASFEEASATAEATFGRGTEDVFIRLTGKIFQGRAFSEIVKFCNDVKKRLVIDQTTFAASFEELLSEMPNTSAPADRREIARLMLDVGFSQRQTSRVSGVARETLRKLKVE